MLNRAVIMGRLTRDPELRTTPSNISVTTFTVAVDRDFARQGEQKETDFLDVVAWRQTAEFVTKYFHKGSMIVVDGRIQTRKWQDKFEQNRTSVEIVADNVHFGESKGSSSGSGDYAPREYSAPSAPSAPAAAPAPKPITGFTALADDTDDVPF